MLLCILWHPAFVTHLALPNNLELQVVFFLCMFMSVDLYKPEFLLKQVKILHIHAHI